MTSESHESSQDVGAILILTLILTVVLAIVVLALSTFAATGLQTSKVTTARTASNSVTSAGLTWYIEELTAKRITPGDGLWCDDPGITQSVPAGALSEPGAYVEVTCSDRAKLDNHPTVVLVANGTTAAGTNRSITAVVQVPLREYTSQIRSWRVD